jgi:hypothetical protein
MAPDQDGVSADRLIGLVAVTTAASVPVDVNALDWKTEDLALVAEAGLAIDLAPVLVCEMVRPIVHRGQVVRHAIRARDRDVALPLSESTGDEGVGVILDAVVLSPCPRTGVHFADPVPGPNVPGGFPSCCTICPPGRSCPDF